MIFYESPFRIIETLKSYFKSWNDKYYILFCLGINTGLRVSDLRCLRVYNIENDTPEKIRYHGTDKPFLVEFSGRVPLTIIQ